MRAPVVCLVLTLFGPLGLLSHASLQENHFREDADRSISAPSGVLEHYAALARPLFTTTSTSYQISKKNDSSRKKYSRALRCGSFLSFLSLVAATAAGCVAPPAGRSTLVPKDNINHRALLLATRKVDTKATASRLEDTMLGKSLGGAAHISKRVLGPGGAAGRLSPAASWAPAARMRAPVFAFGLKPVFRHGGGPANVVPQGTFMGKHKTPQTPLLLPRTRRNVVQGGHPPPPSAGPRVSLDTPQRDHECPNATLDALVELTSDLLCEGEHAIDPSIDAYKPGVYSPAAWMVALNRSENFPNRENLFYAERHLHSTGEPEQFGK